MARPAPTQSISSEAVQVRVRMPRDAQRRRVYLAETPLPSSPLPGLDACANFADRVVGTLWWQQRFTGRDLGSIPRFRPGNGARQAFYREEPGGPTITLPRRYRTKGVVLHELAHWALGLDCELPPHGRTFARVLLDATAEFCGEERAAELAASYREQRVHVGKPARCGLDGQLRYGFDERLHLGRGRRVHVAHTATQPPHGERDVVTTGVFAGYARGASHVRLTHLDDGRRDDDVDAIILTKSVFEVTYAREEDAHGKRGALEDDGA
jgi:putative metallohydrolase (TIGR04338 family)